MPHQDEGNLRRNLREVKAAFEEWLPEELEDFTRHGNASLGVGWLVRVAIICCGWTTQGTLSDRVQAACTMVGRLWNVDTSVSRQGLFQALGTCGEELVQVLLRHLTPVLAKLSGHWTAGGKVNVAVDGSKMKAPRTEANQQAFSPSRTSNRRGRAYQSAADASKAATVQLLMTVFWHLGTGLPLWWVVRGSNGSERKSVREWVAQLPTNTRLIGDAEYVGYPLWSTIIAAKRSFLFRVGANVTLLKNLGRYKFQDGYVYFWPEKVMKAVAPPLVLKLFQIHDGRKAICLVTNELEMSEQMAGDLYARRWGVEVYFRTIKQTLGRRKLLCGSPANVVTELNWTLLGTWFALYLGKQTLFEERLPLQRLSPVKVLRAFQLLVNVICLAVDTPLLRQLLAAATLIDESQRQTSKKSRHYPRQKQHQPCGTPRLLSSTTRQRTQAKKLNL